MRSNNLAVASSSVLYAESHDHPLASPEEVIQLSRRIQKNKDQSARHRLAEANLRLVFLIANHYRGWGGLPFDDLVQAGNEGLMKAVDKFDSERGVKFSFYASYWIRATIMGAIKDNGKIRLSRAVQEKIRRMNQITVKLSESLGREPTDNEIARKMGFSLSKLKRVQAAAEISVDVSLDSSYNGSNRNSPLGEHLLLSCDERPGPDEEVERQELHRLVQKALSRLPKRTRQMIASRVGLDDDIEHTFREIGEQFGLSRERIRQIEAEALRALYNGPEAEALQDYLE